MSERQLKEMERERAATRERMREFLKGIHDLKLGVSPEEEEAASEKMLPPKGRRSSLAVMSFRNEVMQKNRRHTTRIPNFSLSFNHRRQTRWFAPFRRWSSATSRTRGA